VGASSRTNTLLLPHSPGALADQAGQIRTSLLAAGQVGRSHPPGGGHSHAAREEQVR
jgi:hypothetical protein